MSKYGEPWVCNVAEDIHGKKWVEFFDSEYISILSSSDIVYPKNAAKRIITCVNACTGMEDPEKEIADLREQNASLLRLIADIRAAAGDQNGRLMLDELVEHIGELVRAFNAGVHLYLELGGEAESKEVAKALHCKQETVRRLWGLWPKQDPEINPGDPSDETGGVI